MRSGIKPFLGGCHSDEPCTANGRVHTAVIYALEVRARFGACHVVVHAATSAQVGGQGLLQEPSLIEQGPPTSRFQLCQIWFIPSKRRMHLAYTTLNLSRSYSASSSLVLTLQALA